MKFLLAQFNPVVGDLEGNAKKILNIASKACSISADFVLTPELSLWGYPANDLLFKKNLIKNQYNILDKLALDINKKYKNLSITVGMAEIINDSFFPNLYNSVALLEGGEWKIIARKIILPSYEVFDEKRYFRSEEKVSVLIKQIKNKTWRLGFTICEDLWVNKDIEIKQLKSFSEDLSSWDIEQTKPEKNKFEDSEMSSIFDALVLGVRDYAKKCGFKTALIGLSGGIDSALVSAIATAALGSNNIYSVSMPSKWSSSHSKSDAKDLAKRLKINFNSIPIENLKNLF